METSRPLQARKHPQRPRSFDPLASIGAASTLVVLVDVDSFCTSLDWPEARELVDILRKLAATETQILLVSGHAQALATALNMGLEGAWWCDRTSGWHDGPLQPRGETAISFALVVSQLRKRLPDVRVLALSNDARLWAALDHSDRIIAFGRSPDNAPLDILIAADRPLEVLSGVIDIRINCRRFAGDHCKSAIRDQLKASSEGRAQDGEKGPRPR